MKKILIIMAAAVIGFILYGLLSGETGKSGRRGTTSPTPAPVSSTPAFIATPADPGVQQQPAATRPHTVVQSTPNPYAPTRPGPSANRPTPTRPAGQMVDQRSAEVRRIIYECARRAGWKITRYQQPAYGVSHVTGQAPNDNVRNQRFLDEIQRSGILRDIDTARSRPFIGRDQRSYLESTFIIKWR